MIEKLSQYNFLKKLSLVRQLLVVLGIFALAVLFVLMPLVDYNMNSIIDNQMYETLNSSQEFVISESIIPDNRKSKQVYHMLYNVSTHTFIKTNLVAQFSVVDMYYNLFGLDLTTAIENQTSVVKNKGDYNGVLYYYMITQVDGDTYLISVMNNEYSVELISALRNQIIYIQYGFVFIFAIVMIVWVMTLINPLKKIKNYIDQVKDGKNPELSITSEDEIGVVSKALVEMKEELDQQAKTKEEMIHNISHDLKTPIALIQTYGQSVKDDIYPYGDKNSSMDIILENAERLEKKVKSLLYLNRLDYLSSNSGEVGMFDMEQLIDKVVSQMDALKPELTLDTELENVSFIGDEEHWRIAIENIIENASRYAKTKIKITLKDKELSIYNDGEAIEDEFLPYLFNPYAKGVKGQFGLGLSIVSKVSKMYGYDVNARNEEEGVTFVFSKQKKD